MSNYNSLKTTIDANIKQNGRQEITGQILNSILNQMVNTLGAGYQFAGVATTATNPGTPDAKVFYIANGKGTYTNFGGVEVTEDDVVVLYWDSTWHKVSTGIASQAKLTELENRFTTRFDFNISISGEQLPNINKETGILDFGADPNFYVGQQHFISSDFESEDDYRAIQLHAMKDGDSSRRKLVFNLKTKKFRTKNYDIDLNDYEVLVGAFVTQYSTSGYVANSLIQVNLPFEYTINGKYAHYDEVSKAMESILPGKGFTPQFLHYIGSANEGIRKDVALMPNNRYKIILSNTNWDMTGVLPKQNRFSIGYSKNNVSHDIIAVPVGSTLQSVYYIDTIEADYYYIFLRAATGENVYVKLLNDPYVDESADNLVFIGDVHPNIDTIKGILDLGADPNIMIRGLSFKSSDFESEDDYRAIPLQAPYMGDSSRRKLYFNLLTKKFRSVNWNDTNFDKVNDILVGGFVVNYRELGGYQSGDFRFATLPFEYTIDNRPMSDKAGTGFYEGEPLPIRRYFYANLLYTLSEFGQITYTPDSQGMDIYDNKYLIQGNESDNVKSIYILDLEHKTILGNFLFTETGNWHLNNINCANKENTTDKYPLVYISECYGMHRCAVVKFNDNATGYQIKQMITFNTTQHFGGGSNPYDWFIDIENNLLYGFGMPTSEHGPIEIVKFNLPSLQNETVTLTDNNVLDSFIVQGIGVYQGSKLVNGKLICPVGFGSSEWPAFIKVIDLEKKKIVTSVPWPYGEPEAAAIFKDGLIISTNSTNPQYYLLTI